MACPRGSPLSADASDPQIRSVIEVANRNRNIPGSSALKTFSARKSAMAWCRPEMWLMTSTGASAPRSES
ncbi:MAG TPA: hypothetical protein VN803_06635, partial [Gemmatimonadales bacterium]|nr:hypothetical protein [Gemmatimonadales bacterium]